MKTFRIVIALVWMLLILPLMWVNWHNGKILTRQSEIISAREKLMRRFKDDNINEWPKLDAKFDSLGRVFECTHKDWITIW